MEESGGQDQTGIKTPSDATILLSAPGPDELFAVFEDDGETGYLYVYQQGAEPGRGILGAVHVYNKAQCPRVRSSDIHLGWNASQTACWVRVGDVYRELGLTAEQAR